MKRIFNYIGLFLRETGQALDRTGCQLQGNRAYKEQLSRHRRLMPLNDKCPQVSHSAFIAPNATIIGDVYIGHSASIWYGAVLRGDINDIKVGENSSIGDRVIVHVSQNGPKGVPTPTSIGNRVLVEHGVTLHGCTLQDDCRVESGSVILDGVVVEPFSIVGSGSVVPAGKIIPSGQYWVGNPARFVRAITAEEKASFKQRISKAFELAQQHDEEHNLNEYEREKRRNGHLYKEVRRQEIEYY